MIHTLLANKLTHRGKRRFPVSLLVFGVPAGDPMHFSRKTEIRTTHMETCAPSTWPAASEKRPEKRKTPDAL